MHSPRLCQTSRPGLFGGSLLAVLALSACSAGKPAGDAAGPPAPSGGAGGGAASAGVAGSSNAASGGGVSSSGGNGLSLDLDASTGDDDGGGCTHLNIGILGNPGANASSNFEQWLTASGTSVRRIQTTPDEPMTSATLAPFDVVVVDWLTRDYTADEAAVFGGWVSAGGGVAAMSGYVDDTTVDWRANSLLAPLGVAYSGGKVSGPISNFVTHPITAGLTSVTFTGGYAVSDLGGTKSTRAALAFLPDTTPPAAVAFAVQMGAGRAFVWGDEWIEFDSEWSSLPQIPKLWVQIFGWIAPMTKCSLTPPK